MAQQAPFWSGDLKFQLLTAILIFLAYFRSSTSDAKDPYKCSAALTTGRWLDSPGFHRQDTTLQKWQPDGCMLRPYSARAIGNCLHAGDGQDAVFIGDSTVRQVFWAMARKLNRTAADTQSKKVEKHADITFTSGKTSLSFKWDPYLNSTMLPQYLRHSRVTQGSGRDEDDDGDAVDFDESTMSRALVVVGAGLWFARDKGHAVEDFRAAMDKIALPKQPPFYHTSTEPGANRIFFLPVQPPYYERLDQDHKATILPGDINAMNAYMYDLPNTYGVDTALSFLKMAGNMPEAYQANGLHVSESIAEKQAEAILNIRCNQYEKDYPFVGTCCYDYPIDWAQIIILVVGAVTLASVGWIELREWAGANNPGPLENMKKRLPLVKPLLVMWACLFYCYLGDRTTLFEKVMKQYNNQDFFIFCAGIILAGGLTIYKSANPAKAGQEKPSNVDQPFLSRDQTDEWKGWMQALILAYHYTGASKVLWIYKIIRLLVASYLFMSGYGHAAYFYQKADFSLKRVVAVNVRLNLLSCLLPWAMDSDYLFYYFAPLVTYWYAIIYITMRIKSDWNQNLPLFLTKIAVACTCTTLFHTQAALLEPVFVGINTVFGSKWDAHEWMFRCALDQYIVYVGMIVAVLYIRQSKPPPPPAPPQDGFSTTAHTKSGMPPHLRRAGFFVASGASALFYAWASHTRTTKSSSNQLHTYISPFAILAFVHLRNSTRALRNHYSAAYAWLGKVSLETFILQYHLWLAADTRGLLSLGIFGHGGMSGGTGMLGGGMGLARWLDCILLGTVFVWVSWKTATATGGITAAVTKMIFG